MGASDTSWSNPYDLPHHQPTIDFLNRPTPLTSQLRNQYELRANGGEGVRLTTIHRRLSASAAVFKTTDFTSIFGITRLSSSPTVRYNPAHMLGHVLGHDIGHQD
jgi:hypothetical protein